MSELDSIIQAIQNLDARIREVSASVRARSCYDVLPIDSPWTPISADVGYVRFPDGLVSLSGQITGLDTGLVFTLPPGYRPASNQCFALAYGGTACVGTNGEVAVTELPNQLIDAIHEEFAPSASDTTVTLASTPGVVLLVTRNPWVQSEDDGHYSVLGATITFSTPFAAGERVVVSYTLPISAPAQPYHEEITPDLGDTVVLLSHEPFTVLDVARNGNVQSVEDGDYTVIAGALVFSTAFLLGETVVVAYTALPSFYGTPRHDEYSPSVAATTVTLLGTPAQVFVVARNGIAQSKEYNHYVVANTTITFSIPFAADERVVISWVKSNLPPLSLSGIGFRAGG